MKKLFSFLILALLNVSVSANTDKVNSAISNGDWDRVISLITPTAEKGDLLEQYRLGLLYSNKVYGNFNADRAIYWFNLASKHKVNDENKSLISEAQYELLQIYVEGKGIDKDELLAYYWATKSARNGHLQAMSELADLYISSERDGVPINPKQSYKWYKVFIHFAKVKLKSGDFDWEGEKDYLNEVIPAIEKAFSNNTLISDNEKLAIDLSYVYSCIKDISGCS